MKIVQSEKGVTLLEVLLSIVILTIILLTSISFFPQMGFMNKQNAEKTQAINTAKQLLVKWQNNNEVKAYLANPATAVLTQYPQHEGDYYIFADNEGGYIVKIKIKTTPSKSSDLTKAHLIVVQLLNDKGNMVSETYGYITR